MLVLGSRESGIGNRESGIGNKIKVYLTRSRNAILIQYFAYLNAILLFVETSKRQIQVIIKSISLENVVAEMIQDSGEDLGTLLGKVIEEEMRVRKN
ncbi:MAG: hypothetical protein ACRDEA_08120 [Microcystaceae cyanobacterium]